MCIFVMKFLTDMIKYGCVVSVKPIYKEIVRAAMWLNYINNKVYLMCETLFANEMKATMIQELLFCIRWKTSLINQILLVIKCKVKLV